MLVVALVSSSGFDSRSPGDTRQPQCASSIRSSAFTNKACPEPDLTNVAIYKMRLREPDLGVYSRPVDGSCLVPASLPGGRR